MGETNYLRRCDFFKWELKIINHFYTKMAKKIETEILECGFLFITRVKLIRFLKTI